MLSQQLLIELKEIMKSEYNAEIDMAMASEVGESLVQYFEALWKLKN